MKSKILALSKNEEFKSLLKKKKVSDLTTSKHPGSIGNSYIQSNEGRLFVASANGIFSFITLDHFFLDNSKLNIIPSNIRDIIKNPKFYARSAYGIKDLLIHENKFYISYTNEYKKDCYNTSILVSDITIKKSPKNINPTHLYLPLQAAAS